MEVDQEKSDKKEFRHKTNLYLYKIIWNIYLGSGFPFHFLNGGDRWGGGIAREHFATSEDS